VLEPLAGAEPALRSEAAGEVEALGTALVTLPGYARDPRIASRRGSNRVDIDDEHRWAQEPEEAITRLLAERLRSRAAATVLIEPWPRDFAPEARVEVDFDRLLRTPEGGVEAAGYIRLLSGNGREVLNVQPFRLARRSASVAPAAFFVAVSALVDDLARLALEALREGTPS